LLIIVKLETMFSRNDVKRCEAAKKLKEQLKEELEKKEAIKKQEKRIEKRCNYVLW
jgi:hypothetical protein